MTGNASFNILNASDLAGGRLQGGLFEMHVGKDGFSGRIGMGGTDLSLGTIAGALRGASVLGVNGAIGLYGRANNIDAAVTLRAQYGFGDWAQRGQLASILLGGTELELGGEANGEEAQTTTQNGRRVVHLAGYREGMSVEEQMRLAITLGHEAYRDGQFNGFAGQNQETTQAVMGHTAMMLRMGSDQRYAQMVANMMNGEAGLRSDYAAYMNYATGGSADDYASYVAGNYDSSADYWKLTTDGRLINDNDADLYLTNENGDYLDADGNVVAKKDAVKLVDTQTTSVSQALIQYIGMDRAASLLGVDSSNLSIYDSQTLQDVIGMDAGMVNRLSHNGIMSYADLSLDEQQKLLGELLLKKGAGQIWSAANGWHGDETAEFKITDNWDGYSIGFDQELINSEYNKFVVDIVHTRDALSYFGSIGNQDIKEQYNGLDSSVYIKKDLDGNPIAQMAIDSVQTVDNMWGPNADQTQTQNPYKIFGRVQGNTMAPGISFFSKFGQRSNFDEDVFVTSGGRTLSGIDINAYGHDPTPGASLKRWLTHQKTPENSINAVNLLFSDGCIVNTDVNMQFINQNLSDWNMFNGFNMGTIIYEDWQEMRRRLNGF